MKISEKIFELFRTNNFELRKMEAEYLIYDIPGDKDRFLSLYPDKDLLCIHGVNYSGDIPVIDLQSSLKEFIVEDDYQISQILRLILNNQL